MARGRGGGYGGSRGQSRIAAASYKSSRGSGASRGSSTWAARGGAAAYGRSGTKDAAAAGAYKASRAHGGSKSHAKAAARGAAAAYDQMHGASSGGVWYGGYGGYGDYGYPGEPDYPYGGDPWQRQGEEPRMVSFPSHVDSRGVICFGVQADERYYVGTDWKEVYEKKRAASAGAASTGSNDVPQHDKAKESKPSEVSNAGATSGGCYVATCVYGSYDCSEVWLLRRFRDACLMRSLPGRVFVRAYYSVSPWLVERFGGRARFRSFCKKILDRLVARLRVKGYSDGPYEDLAV